MYGWCERLFTRKKSDVKAEDNYIPWKCTLLKFHFCMQCLIRSCQAKLLRICARNFFLFFFIESDKHHCNCILGSICFVKMFPRKQITLQRLVIHVVDISCQCIIHEDVTNISSISFQVELSIVHVSLFEPMSMTARDYCVCIKHCRH